MNALQVNSICLRTFRTDSQREKNMKGKVRVSSGLAIVMSIAAKNYDYNLTLPNFIRHIYMDSRLKEKVKVLII